MLRYYTERPSGFAAAVAADLLDALGISTTLRIFTRYDVQTDLKTDLKLGEIERFENNPVAVLPESPRLLEFAPLPGQFDALADTAEQCVQLITGGERPAVTTAQVYVLGEMSDSDFERVKAYTVNPLEYNSEFVIRNSESVEAEPVPKVTDLSALDLAMSADDKLMVMKYFEDEGRDPTLTEIMLLDTYWSDHCRHTTFNTIIESAEISDPRVREAFDLFKSVNGDRPVTLMNIATAPMRYFRGRGELPMLDVSDEINACTIKYEDKYIFFKNETHNHPTELEPFGGASTCIGGGIRDPLSGRAAVIQGMRITGAGDPRQPVEDTLPGKLPQRFLSRVAADGFSSYSNQIGLASGFAREIYHPGYIAKRMEAGALVGFAPMSAVRREKPAPGDLVLLLGERTGRDGVGGATGSSNVQGTETSEQQKSAEVQKGNPPAERKIVRLFRNPAATVLIKRCNDFGAGGVSVAVGELADGLEIDLDAVPLKYEGMNGTEIAISESQERMAIVIAQSDLAEMLRYCDEENVEASVIARVTCTPRLVMKWRGETIVDIARSFLDTNGAKRKVNIVNSELPESKSYSEYKELNVLPQDRIIEQFDSSVGGTSVFAPGCGMPPQFMASIIPGTESATVMAYGFDPFIMEADPFGGARDAVVSSVAKLVAAGADLSTIHLSLQEYFPRCDDCPKRRGVPFAAMLGAFSAQMGLKIAAIGGKDSMSGTYEDIDVPPTLISFAVGIGDAKLLVAPAPTDGSDVHIIEYTDDLPALRAAWEQYGELVRAGKVSSAAVFEDDEVYPRNSIVYTLRQPEQLQSGVAHHAGAATPAAGGRRCSVTLPVFAATNGEYDAINALERAGGTANPIVIRNLTPAALAESVNALVRAIGAAQMLVFPGGLDSARLITAMFGNPRLVEAVEGLLARDGLILGINDGFKALVKLGLLGVSAPLISTESGVHLHRYVRTAMNPDAAARCSWLSRCNPDEVYVQPISHREHLAFGDIPNAQIAFRYESGNIEAVTSPDGRILGKTAHFERWNPYTAKNVDGEKFVPIFEGGMDYFK
jgi:phosphoribosylformylglycinamidine synthase